MSIHQADPDAPVLLQLIRHFAAIGERELRREQAEQNPNAGVGSDPAPSDDRRRAMLLEDERQMNNTQT